VPVAPRRDTSNDPHCASVSGQDPFEAATVVEDMASAVERVRRMAATVFQGDAALFADGPYEAPT
jgi:tRNA C32,U32 (ribose-2'-O)-methylase TrmJ